MGRYLIRRFLLMIPMLIGVTLIMFLVGHLVPTDPIAIILPPKALADPGVRQAAIEEWGLDKSLPEQYLAYIWNLLHGDMGRSFTTRKPVLDDLRIFLPATIELALAAMLFAVCVGFPLGIVAALQKGKWTDHSARGIALLGASMPQFWSGLMVLFLFYATLSILPGPGRIDTRMVSPERVTGLLTIDSIIAGNWETLSNCLQHLLLPALVEGWFPLALVARVTRASLLDVLQMDYMRTARAKGLLPRSVTIFHALPNALIPTITVLGLSIAFLLAGAVTTELVFSWPGLGSYMVSAAVNLDYPAVMSGTLVIALVFMFSSLVVDILYGLVDPRIREV